MRFRERLFDPKRDMPLRKGRGKAMRMIRPSLATSRVVPIPPMGDYLWQLTRQVDLGAPFETAHGRSQKRWVYHTRGQRTFVRPWVIPPDPKTSFQTDQRQRLVVAQREWHRLNDAQRDGWERAALQLDPALLACREGRRTRGAMNLFAGAQIQRLSWGEPMRHDPPGSIATGGRAQRPSRAHHVHEVPVAHGEGFAFRVDHLQKDFQGCRLLIEMTPATKSPANKPLERWLTKAGNTDSGSYFALQPSGGQYLLPQPRYAVAPGQRFALRVTIVDADGLRGRSCMRDLVRDDYAAPSFALATDLYADHEGGDQAALLREKTPLSELTAHPYESLTWQEPNHADEIQSVTENHSAVDSMDDTYRMMRGRSPASP